MFGPSRLLASPLWQGKTTWMDISLYFYGNPTSITAPTLSLNKSLSGWCWFTAKRLEAVWNSESGDPTCYGTQSTVITLWSPLSNGGCVVCGSDLTMIDLQKHKYLPLILWKLFWYLIYSFMSIVSSQVPYHNILQHMGISSRSIASWLKLLLIQIDGIEEN